MAAKDAYDGHRPLGSGHDLGAILREHHERVVSNDDVVRRGAKCGHFYWAATRRVHTP